MDSMVSSDVTTDGCPSNKLANSGSASKDGGTVEGGSVAEATSDRITETISFSSGNPRVEATRGVMHWYRDTTSEPGSSEKIPHSEGIVAEMVKEKAVAVQQAVEESVSSKLREVHIRLEDKEKDNQELRELSKRLIEIVKEQHNKQLEERYEERELKLVKARDDKIAEVEGQMFAKFGPLHRIKWGHLRQHYEGIIAEMEKEKAGGPQLAEDEDLSCKLWKIYIRLEDMEKKYGELQELNRYLIKDRKDLHQRIKKLEERELISVNERVDKVSDLDEQGTAKCLESQRQYYEEKIAEMKETQVVGLPVSFQLFRLYFDVWDMDWGLEFPDNNLRKLNRYLIANRNGYQQLIKELEERELKSVKERGDLENQLASQFGYYDIELNTQKQEYANLEKKHWQLREVNNLLIEKQRTKELEERELKLVKEQDDLELPANLAPKKFSTLIAHQGKKKR